MIRLGVIGLALLASAVLAAEPTPPKSESVAIDALLAELDAPGALAGTGLSEQLAHKKRVLHFLRDVVGQKKLDEPLPRDAVARLSVVQQDVGARVDQAILKGLRAKPDALKPWLVEPFTVEGSTLVSSWLVLEAGDKLAAPEVVTRLIVELEANAAEMLRLASQVEGKELKVLPEAPPVAVKYLPQAIAKLTKLGVSAKETASLDKRAKALKARYGGK